VSDLDKLCERLITAANAHGGLDNITVVCARLEPLIPSSSALRPFLIPAGRGFPTRRVRGRAWNDCSRPGLAAGTKRAWACWRRCCRVAAPHGSATGRRGSFGRVAGRSFLDRPKRASAPWPRSKRDGRLFRAGRPARRLPAIDRSRCCVWRARAEAGNTLEVARDSLGPGGCMSGCSGGFGANPNCSRATAPQCVPMTAPASWCWPWQTGRRGN